jgi:hypothetical protein
MQNSQINMRQVPTPVAIGPWQSAYGRWPLRLESRSSTCQVCRNSNQRKTSANNNSQSSYSGLRLAGWHGKNVVVKSDLSRTSRLGICGRRLKSAKCGQQLVLAQQSNPNVCLKNTTNWHTRTHGNAKGKKTTSQYIYNCSCMCARSLIGSVVQNPFSSELKRQLAVGKEFCGVMCRKRNF